MKREYTKPTVGSERVFSLTSQSCDVAYKSPGTCATFAKYDKVSCEFAWKVQTIVCGLFPDFPKERS